MVLRMLFCLLLLSACAGRPMTENEQRFAQSLHGASLDASKVRLIDGAPTRAVTFTRKARPRTTCREKILPPARGETVTAKPAAVALFNRVLFDRDWFLEDYLPRYPGEVNLIAAMLFAHEITHIWQWQNRAVTGYHPLRAAAEHGRFADPYLFDLNAAPRFLDYGYEQQASIVEEFVCCRALDPTGARTARLHDLIAQVMPVAPLPEQRMSDVLLPWDGAEIGGICS